MNTEDMFSRWLEKNKEIKNVEQRLEQQLQASADNLSLKEFCLLFHLSEAPEKSMKLHELERLVGLSQSAMSRLVMRLEGRPCSLIERHQCNLDKRNVIAIYVLQATLRFATSAKPKALRASPFATPSLGPSG